MNVKNLTCILFLLTINTPLSAPTNAITGLSGNTPTGSVSNDARKKSALAAQTAAKKAYEAAQQTQKQVAALACPDNMPTDSINEKIIDQIYGKAGLNIAPKDLAHIKNSYCYLEFLIKIDKVKNDASLAKYKSDFNNFLQPSTDNKPLMPTQELVQSNGWKAIQITSQDIINSPMWQLFIKAAICDSLDIDAQLIIDINQASSQIFQYVPNIETALDNNNCIDLWLYQESMQLQRTMNFEQRQRYFTQCPTWKSLSADKLADAIKTFKATDFYSITHNSQSTTTQASKKTASSSIPSGMREQILCYFMLTNIQTVLYDSITQTNVQSILTQSDSPQFSPNFFSYRASDIIYFYDYFSLQQRIADQKINLQKNTVPMKGGPSINTVAAVAKSIAPTNSQADDINDKNTKDQATAFVFKQIPTISNNESLLDGIYGASGINIAADQVANIKKTYCYLEFLVKVDKVKTDKSFAQYKNDFQKFLTPNADGSALIPTDELVKSNGWKSIPVTGQDIVTCPTWQNYIKTMICDYYDTHDDFINQSSDANKEMLIDILDAEAVYTNPEFVQARLYLESVQLNEFIRTEQIQLYLQQCPEWKNLAPKDLVTAMAKFKTAEFYDLTHSNPNQALNKNTPNKYTTMAADTRNQILGYYLLTTIQTTTYTLMTLDNLSQFLTLASSSKLSPNFFTYTPAQFIYLNDSLTITKLIDQNNIDIAAMPPDDDDDDDTTTSNNNVKVQSIDEDMNAEEIGHSLEVQEDTINDDVVVQGIGKAFKKLGKDIDKKFTKPAAKFFQPLTDAINKSNKKEAAKRHRQAARTKRLNRKIGHWLKKNEKILCAVAITVAIVAAVVVICFVVPGAGAALAAPLVMMADAAMAAATATAAAASAVAASAAAAAAAVSAAAAAGGAMGVATLIATSVAAAVIPTTIIGAITLTAVVGIAAISIAAACDPKFAADLQKNVLLPIMLGMEAMTEAFTTGFIYIAIGATWAGAGFAQSIGYPVNAQQEVNKTKIKMEKYRSTINIAMSVVVTIVITVVIMMLSAGAGMMYAAYLDSCATSAEAAALAAEAAADDAYFAAMFMSNDAEYVTASQAAQQTAVTARAAATTARAAATAAKTGVAVGAVEATTETIGQTTVKTAAQTGIKEAAVTATEQSVAKTAVQTGIKEAAVTATEESVAEAAAVATEQSIAKTAVQTGIKEAAVSASEGSVAEAATVEVVSTGSTNAAGLEIADTVGLEAASEGSASATANVGAQETASNASTKLSYMDRARKLMGYATSGEQQTARITAQRELLAASDNLAEKQAAENAAKTALQNSKAGTQEFTAAEKNLATATGERQEAENTVKEASQNVAKRGGSKSQQAADQATAKLAMKQEAESQAALDLQNGKAGADKALAKAVAERQAAAAEYEQASTQLQLSYADRARQTLGISTSAQKDAARVAAQKNYLLAVQESAEKDMALASARTGLKTGGEEAEQAVAKALAEREAAQAQVQKTAQAIEKFGVNKTQQTADQAAAKLIIKQDAERAAQLAVENGESGASEALMAARNEVQLAELEAQQTAEAAAKEAARLAGRSMFEIGQEATSMRQGFWTAFKQGTMSWSFIIGQVLNAGFSVFGILGAINQDEAADTALKQEAASIRALWGFVEDSKVNLTQNQHAYLDELHKKHQAAVQNQAVGLQYYTNFLNGSVDLVQDQIAQALAQEYIQLLTPDENGLRIADIGASWGLQTQFDYLYPAQGFITTTLGRPDFPYAQEVAQAPLKSETHGDTSTDLSDNQPAATKLWFNQRAVSVLNQSADKALNVEIKFRVLYSLNSAFHMGLYLGGNYHDYNSAAYLQSIKDQGAITLDDAHLAKMFVLKRDDEKSAPSIGLYENEGLGWIAQDTMNPQILNSASVYHMSANLNKDTLTISFWPEDNPSAKWSKTTKVTPCDQRTFGVIFSGIAIQWGVVQPNLPITENKKARAASNGQSEADREKASKAQWKQLLSPKFGSMTLQSSGRPAILQGQYLYTTQSTGLVDAQGQPITDYVVFATASGKNVTGLGAQPPMAAATNSTIGSTANANALVSLITGNAYNSSGKITTNVQNALSIYAQNNKNVISQALSDAITQAGKAYQQQLLSYSFGSFQLTAVSQDAINAGLYIYTCPTTLPAAGINLKDRSGKTMLDYLIMADLVNNSLGATAGMPPSSSVQGMVSLVSGNVYSRTSATPVDSGYAQMTQYTKQYGKLPQAVSQAISLVTTAYNNSLDSQAAAAQAAKTAQVNVVASQTLSFDDLLNSFAPTTGGAQIGLSSSAPSTMSVTKSSLSQLQTSAAGTATIAFGGMGAVGLSFGDAQPAQSQNSYYSTPGISYAVATSPSTTQQSAGNNAGSGTMQFGDMGLAGLNFGSATQSTQSTYSAPSTTYTIPTSTTNKTQSTNTTTQQTASNNSSQNLGAGTMQFGDMGFAGLSFGSNNATTQPAQSVTSSYTAPAISYTLPQTKSSQNNNNNNNSQTQAYSAPAQNNAVNNNSIDYSQFSLVGSSGLSL